MICLNNREHGKKIAEACGAILNPADVVISRTADEKDDFELLGGVIYKNYTGASMEMHVASFRDRWINPDLLWVCFHYPFVKCNCKKVFALVPSKNLSALVFDRKLGFELEAQIADVYPDDDLVVMSMKKEECRWLSIKPKGIKEK